MARHSDMLIGTLGLLAGGGGVLSFLAALQSGERVQLVAAIGFGAGAWYAMHGRRAGGVKAVVDVPETVTETIVPLERRLEEIEGFLDVVPVDRQEEIAMAEMSAAGLPGGPTAVEELRRLAKRGGDDRAYTASLKRLILALAAKRLTADLRGADPWSASTITSPGHPKFEPRAVAPVPVERARLTVMVGPCGAGKSTWAKANRSNEEVISSDAIRDELKIDGDRVFKEMRERAKARLARGLPVTLDATHLSRERRLAAVDLVGAEENVEYVVVNRPVAEKKATGCWRNEHDGMIEKQEHEFRQAEQDILSGDGRPNVRVIDTRVKAPA